MRIFRIVLAALTLSVGLHIFFNQSAYGAVTSVATANVNLRAGPSTAYPVVVTVPAGATVTTYGCVSGYTWCDVAFGTYRGWIAAGYLQTVHNDGTVVLSPVVAPALGLAVVTYNRAYWDRYYTAYPWHGRWTTFPAGAVKVRGGSVTGPAGNTYKGGAVCGPRGCAGGVSGPNGRAAGVRRW